MSSTLGGSFGLAISVAVYSGVQGFGNVEAAASAGLTTNIIFAALALVAIITTVPKGFVVKEVKGEVTELGRARKAL